MVRIKPRSLRPGDTIAVVSPASAIDDDRLGRGLAVMEKGGYIFKLFPHTRDADDYLAGSDADRAADLMAAFDDPECAAVMCSRGGYGCSRLFPFIDLDRMAASGKMLCGFSDITVLHLALNRRGLVTMHTPMPITLSYEREPWVHDSFFRLLQGDPTIAPEVPRAETMVDGTGEGELTGGCLCLLCDSIGTPDALDCRGKILVIEDVDEKPHRVDAMLTHLINTGIIQEAAGIVVGEMTRTDDLSDPTMGGKSWRWIFEDRLGKLGIPTVVNFPFGHMKTMLSIPLGVQARLNAGEGTLTYLESPCAEA
ncbi:MAG: LD-carboxypeptidase [Armatimonadetes bacterium]|nr:LD-carboxypeptidase [Armatimonadota bacterium]